ncbi:MAG: oligoendopeptidase F [candidate division Zixibacteria bacterium]|nr:oligoendopeptidase F [candidate division Zixibacteria bacterium]
MNRTTCTSILGLLILVFALLVPSALAEKNAVPQRSDIDDQYKWKLEDIYPNNDAWESDFAYLDSNIARLEGFKGHLGDSPDNMLACFKLRDSLEAIEWKLYVYAYLKLDQDNRVSESQETAGRISSLGSRMSAYMSYISPELLTISEDSLQLWLANNSELDVFRHYLDDERRLKDHVLSKKEEELLAMAGQVTSAPSRIFSMTTNADLTFGTVINDDGEEIQLTRQRYYSIMETGSRRLRHEANQVYNKAYKKYLNTLAATLSTSVKKDNFYRKARGYNSCLEMSLKQDNIPESVFNSLIKAVNDNLAPLHKLTALRKKVLGYDTLYTYDLSVSLVPESQREYPWKETKEIVLKGLEPMGEEYLANFKTGLNSQWIDVFETQGKGSGAYQWGTYHTHPYVLLNHNKTLGSVFTLAHEMGHAMHSFYTHKNEPYIYGGNPIFLAEVASTCNEALLMKYLIEHTTDKTEKLYLLNYYIEQIMGTFYTQVMFSEFEIAVHKVVEEGGALSAEQMRKTYRGIYQKYWGPDLVIDSINDMGCMRISHFYSQFYVYKYATSYAAAQMVSQKILEDPSYLDTYLNFLSTGSSKYPVEILKDAGVDVTSSEPVERTIKLFGELVDEMEKLLNERQN